MSDLLIPIVCVVLIVLLTLFFRVSGALVFLLLTAGIVLQSEIGNDAVLLATSGISGQTVLVENIVRVGLAMMPLIVACLLLKKTLSKSKIVFHILPLVSGVLMFILFLPRMLNTSVGDKIAANSLYLSADKMRVAVYLIGILSSIVVLMLEVPKHHEEGHHKSRH